MNLTNNTTCAPCRDGNHYYCILIQFNGLHRLYDMITLRQIPLHFIVVASCSCGCSAETIKDV